VTAAGHWPNAPLITAGELAEIIAEGSALLFDCRFDLKHPAQGRDSWLSAHIPGALYAHLDQDLSGPLTGDSGRHPLPQAVSFASFLARSGYRPDKKVIAYDAQGGAFAARLWWLMHYFGLGRTALLDGGIGAWVAAGYPVESGEVSAKPRPLPRLQPQREMTLDAHAVRDGLESGVIQLLDARADNRFRGEDETIDAVAGHVPGAINRPFQSNLDEAGRFRPPAELRAGFRKILGKRGPEQVVHMCGSGVTACQNLLAMELAGLPGSRLFPESWSGWISDRRRPVALGQD
jgi:thiosulfate/3-mercaptopyruvate sulfurtransferase